MNPVGAIVEPRPAIWRRVARWYLGVLRRMKAYQEDPENVPIPLLEITIACLGFAAMIGVATLASNWSPWMWLAFPFVAAAGIPLFWRMISLPGG